MANPLLAVVLHLAALLLVLLDFVIWIVMLGPLSMVWKYLTLPSVWSRIVGVAEINGDLDPSAVWQSTDSAARGALCESPFPGEVATVYQLLERAWRIYGSRQAQGIRPLLKWQTDEGYKFPAKVFGPTQWRTYSELASLAKAFGSALRSLGVEPQPQGDFNTLQGKFKILMYEDTCADWMMCAQGAFSQNIVVATAYATLGVEAVIDAVNEGSITVIVCNRKSVPMLLKQASKMPSLEVIVFTDFLCTPEECSQSIKSESSLRVLSLGEAVELGKAKLAEPTQPQPDSVAVLMYTSGSTGKAKGVVVRHRQLLGMVGGCRQQFGVLMEEGGETYIGYLPLAHILELTAETYFYGMGNRVGYADPKSLLAGPERCYPCGGLEEFQPTLMAGVPKVWETIKKGAEAKIEKSGTVAGFLFKVAMRVKRAAIRQNRFTPLFDLIIFKKFKKMIGGSMKFSLSGGGAISADVQEWVRAAFGCPLVQGYGLTETCGGATIQHPLDIAVGIAGSTLSSVEITLHSEREITDANGNPYLATDKVHTDGTACEGRGEVWLRGTSITSGYYKMPEKTAEDFDAQGWFHTGDIGLMTPAGQLRIVDRKKNLVKLKGGEYVALELMNVTYNNADIINADAGGVCSFADDSLDRPVAFAQCKLKELTALAREAGVVDKEGEELCRDPRVMKAVKAKLDVVAKAANLPSLMCVVAVMPLLEPWTAANGCLTATSKLVSKEVYKAHAEDLKMLKALGTRG